MAYNYYQILEIDTSANSEEIKHAFRNKAKLYHPDKNRSPKAHEFFKVVKDAYETLIDPEKRDRYDSMFMSAIRLKEKIRKKYGYYNLRKNTVAGNSVFGERRRAPVSKQSRFIYFAFFVFGISAGFLMFIYGLLSIKLQNWQELFYCYIMVSGIIIAKAGFKEMIELPGSRGLLKKIRTFFLPGT